MGTRKDNLNELVSAQTVTNTKVMRPGDKVCRTPLLSSEEEISFYTVRSVDVASNSFTTDPNSPFEKSWKGRLNDHKPHHVYPGYWVPVLSGVNREIAMRAERKKRGLDKSASNDAS